MRRRAGAFFAATLRGAGFFAVAGRLAAAATRGLAGAARAEELGMDRADGRVEIPPANHAADLHLRRADAVDVHAHLREGREHARREARRRGDARPDDRDLRDVEIDQHLTDDLASAPGRFELLDQLDLIVVGDERDAVAIMRRRGLDDQADVDVLAGEVTEDGGGQARFVAHVDQRDLGDLLVRRDAYYRCVFHHSSTNPGARAAVERRPHVNGHVVLHADLRGTRVQHLGATGGEFDRRLVAHLRHQLRRVDDVGVGGVHAIDVGADLAHRRLQRRRERRAGDVAAAAPERGDLVVARDALEPGHDDDTPAFEFVDQSPGVDLRDPRPVERPIRADPALRGGERHGRHAAVLQREAEQRHGDRLATGQQLVHLAARRTTRHLARHRDQLVGRLAHRGDGHHHVPCFRLTGDDSVGDVDDAFGRGDGTATVLLHEELRALEAAHACSSTPASVPAR